MTVQAISFLDPIRADQGDEHTPDFVLRMRSSWRQFRALDADVRSRVSNIHTSFGVDYHVSYGVDLNGAMASAKDRLVKEAVKWFSPVGGVLDISTTDIVPCTPADFDPVAAWASLRALYGDRERMSFRVFHQIAQQIVRTFRLDEGAPVHSIGGRTSLSIVIYGDRTCGRALSYRDRERVVEALGFLISAAEWANVLTPQISEALKVLKNDMWSRSNEALPRTQLGELILVVPYKSKYEFRLSPSFSEQFNVFVGQYDGFSEASC